MTHPDFMFPESPAENWKWTISEDEDVEDEPKEDLKKKKK